MTTVNDILVQGLRQLGLEADPGRTGKFTEYLHILAFLPYNLTSIRDEKQIIIRHFLDSVSILRNFSFSSCGISNTQL